MCARLAFARGQKSHIDKSRISAITDEIGTTPEGSIAFAKEYGLQWVELRSVPGTQREYAFLPEDEIKSTAASFAANGLRVSFMNTSLLKFAWPGMDPVRRKPESEVERARRMASETARFERRMDDLSQAIDAARILGVDRIRVFTGSRVAEPATLFPRIAEVLGQMAHAAGEEKIHLLIENEGSCNVATSAELAALMKLTPSKWIGMNWDPQNSLAREIPFPDGYALLPKNRIHNVQIKAKGVMEGPQRLDWKSILQALDRDGYQGEIGLETHIFDGTLIAAAHTSMREILRLVSEL
jgi:sugar phosphate isomerase/epimerase